MTAASKYLIALFLITGNLKSTLATQVYIFSDTDIIRQEIDTLFQLQYDLADSSKLIHIKNQFYRSYSGHLYERTWAQDIKKSTSRSPVFYEYFCGDIPQKLDPLSFVQLNGWFAKDKNLVYYYRPMDGGMLISIMNSADVKSFKVLKGDYRFATDRNHVYNEAEIIENMNPANLKVIRDKKGKILKLQSNGQVLTVL